MWKPLARSFDAILSMTLARFVRPRGELPRPHAVPDGPDDVNWPELVELELTPLESPPAKGGQGEGEPQWDFSFPSPVPSSWKENETVRGLALGPQDARRAIILLHGAYEDHYTHAVWMARSFTKHGYRVLIPAGPYHLQRKPPGVFSGSPMFWSPELVVAGFHQWLAEIRGLMGYLRREGAQQIGLYGYSLGSLVAGLAATLWRDLDFIALLSPVGSHADAIGHSRVAGRIWPWMRDIPQEKIALLDRWAAVHRQPLTDRMAFFITRYDNLQPTRLQEQWWEAWGRPPRRDYPHAHLSVHYCKQFYRDLAMFAEEGVRDKE